MTSYEFPVYARLDIEIAEGDGVVVRTTDGAELIDFYGGHAVAALGYGHPRLQEALEQQARRLHFQTNLVDLDVRRQACRALARFAPDGLDRVFLVSTGAEANENALRLAFRERPERRRVVALEGGFHGRTAAAGACTWGSAKWYSFPERPFETVWVPADDPEALSRAVDGSTAAVIFEPVQGIAGARPISTEMVRAARQATRRHGAWLIADEVQCGVGRAGRPFAIEDALAEDPELLPDLLTTAKGLAGGFPAAAVLANREIADILPTGALGTTFGGGPLACAMIRVVVECVEEPGFLERVQGLGERIQQTCRVGPVVETQGRGLLIGLVCDRPAKQVLPELRRRGILAGGASDPTIVRLMPPLTLEERHVDALAAALAEIPPADG